LRLAAYHLVEKLGEGTFSEVFKWRCEDRGTQVAVKCMKDMYQTMDEVSAKQVPSSKRGRNDRGW
jgi:serine/threonine protein kinase